MTETQLIAQLATQQASTAEVPGTGEVGFSKSSWGAAC